MTIEDESIIIGMEKNPEKGFRMLMEKYEKPLYWHIRRLVVDFDDAQDVAQDTFVRIFRSFSSFHHGNSFKAWLYKIATNEALRFLDKHKDTKLSIKAEEVNTLISDNYVDYSDVEAVKLQNAILSLPNKQQAAFNMRYYDEIGYEEIGQVLGSSAAAAKMNYHLAKDKIVKFMTEHN